MRLFSSVITQEGLPLALAAGTLAAALVAPVRAQAPQATPATPACPSTSEVEPRQLFGLWTARLDGDPRRTTLLLEANREHGQSLGGAVSRDGVKAWLAGDLEEGAFTLEESLDGITISATWTGRLVDKGCGKQITGEWAPAGAGSARQFVLEKQSGW